MNLSRLSACLSILLLSAGALPAAFTKVADYQTLVPGSITRYFTRFDQVVTTDHGVAFLSVEGTLGKAYYHDGTGLRALNTASRNLGSFNGLAVDGPNLYVAASATAYVDAGLYRLEGEHLVALDASLGDLPTPAAQSSVVIDKLVARAGKVAVQVSRYLPPPAVRSYLGLFVFSGGVWTKVIDNTAPLAGTDKVLSVIYDFDLDATGSKVLLALTSDQGGEEIWEWDGAALAPLVTRGQEILGKQFYPTSYGAVAYLADGTRAFHGYQWQGDTGIVGIGATTSFLLTDGTRTYGAVGAIGRSASSGFQRNGAEIATLQYVGVYPDGANTLFNLDTAGQGRVLVSHLSDFGGSQPIALILSRGGVQGDHWALRATFSVPNQPPNEAIYTNLPLGPVPAPITTDFPGAQDFGSDTYLIDPFDFVYAPPALYPWVYAFGLNSWIYLVGDAQNCYFYRLSPGTWAYTNASFWGWYYDFSSANWVSPAP